MILENLHSAFQREIEVMSKALEIEKQKSVVILQAKTEKLLELSNQSDQLLQQMIEIENQRYTLLGNLFEKYKDRVQSESINMSSLVKIMETLRDEYYSKNNKKEEWENKIDSLIEILKKFKETAESLKMEVITNQKLLNRTKTIINELMDQVEKRDKTYGYKKNSKVGQSYLVNQSI